MALEGSHLSWMLVATSVASLALLGFIIHGSPTRLDQVNTLV
jgi:hypothetical protein